MKKIDTIKAIHMSNNSHKYILSIVAGIMLLLAIPPIWAYGFFQILRWVVAGVAVYNAFNAHEHGKQNWVWVMVGIAILFNPISPIHFSKETWAVLDFITAVVMFVSAKQIKSNYK